MDRVTASDQAQRWQRRLSKLKLPVFRDDRTALLRQLGDPNSTAVRIGEQVVDHPLICLHLFCEINRYELDSRPIVDPGHAISMLGLDNCASLLRALPVFPEGGATPEFQRVVSNSLWAAEWAQYLSDELRLTQQRGVYWRALFHRSSRWLAALAAPTQLEGLQHKAGEHFVPSGLSKEYRLLGSDSWQLGRLLPALKEAPRISRDEFLAWRRLKKRDWIAASRLPLCAPNTPAGLRRSHYLDLTEDSRELNVLRQHSAGAVLLANLLIDELDYCWYSRQSQRLIRLAAAWLKQSPDQVELRLKQLALNISHQYPQFGPGPAARLLCQWPGQNSSYWQPDTPEVETSKPLTTHQRLARDLDRVKQVHHQLRQAPPNTFKQLIELLLDGLHHGLGAEHVTLWLPHHDRNMLLPQYALADQEPVRVPIGLSRPSLFNKLVEKPRELHLHRGHALWNKLPGYFRAKVSEGECLFRSLFHNQRAIAVLYLDRGDSDKGFQAQEIRLFHTLMQDFEWALQQLSQRKAPAQGARAPVQSTKT